MSLDAQLLIGQLAPPLDHALVDSLIAEFLDLERRYALGDWEPATLNGGQFAEVAARIIYHVDSGNVNRTKGLDPCLTYVEDANTNNAHSFPQRRAALHLCKVLRTIYKLRSQRGAVHIDPDYSANELDSTLILSLARWVIAEVLRLFWGGNSSQVAGAIREIVRYQVPAILQVDGKALVLRTDCTGEEEILILLHNAGEKGMSRTELGGAVMKSQSVITTSLQALVAPDKRQVIARDDGTYVITPNGLKRIHDELATKLTLS